MLVHSGRVFFSFIHSDRSEWKRMRNKNASEMRVNVLTFRFNNDFFSSSNSLTCPLQLFIKVYVLFISTESCTTTRKERCRTVQFQCTVFFIFIFLCVCMMSHHNDLVFIYFKRKKCTLKTVRAHVYAEYFFGEERH